MRLCGALVVGRSGVCHAIAVCVDHAALGRLTLQTAPLLRAVRSANFLFLLLRGLAALSHFCGTARILLFVMRAHGRVLSADGVEHRLPWALGDSCGPTAGRRRRSACRLRLHVQL
jgi:hypothetical protein